MKNDTKMREYFSKLWKEYMDTKVTENDNLKALENSKIIFAKYQQG